MPNWKKLITSGSAASLSSLSLDTALPVSQGGTGATTLTSNGILTGNGTSAIQAESNLTFDGTNLRLQADNAPLTIGANNDLKIQHTGTNTFISQVNAATGNLYIDQNVDDGDLVLRCDDGAGGVTSYITLDGSATTVEIAKTTNVDGTLTATGDVVAFYSSDKRLKDNIVRIENPLEKVGKIGGYTFDWNDKQETYTGKDVGVIAQEIQEVLPELVTERDNGYLAVKYEKIVPLLIESIKELKQEVDEIKQKCDCLNK